MYGVRVNLLIKLLGLIKYVVFLFKYDVLMSGFYMLYDVFVIFCGFLY